MRKQPPEMRARESGEGGGTQGRAGGRVAQAEPRGRLLPILHAR